MPQVIDLRTGNKQRNRERILDSINQMIQNKMQRKEQERQEARQDTLYERQQMLADRNLQNQLSMKNLIEVKEDEEGAIPIQFNAGTKFYKQIEEPFDAEKRIYTQNLPGGGKIYGAIGPSGYISGGLKLAPGQKGERLELAGLDENNQQVFEGSKGLQYLDGSLYAGPPLKNIRQTAMQSATGKGKSFGELGSAQKEKFYQAYFLNRQARPDIASRDVEGKRQWNDGWSNWLEGLGLTGADLELARTDMGARRKTLDKMVPAHNQMKAFVANINNQVDSLERRYSDIENDPNVKEVVDRMGMRVLDVPRRYLLNEVKGSGAERAIEALLKEVSAEISKLSQGAQNSIAQLPEGNREEWEKIHDPNLSLNELMIVLDATREMANMREQSYGNIVNNVRGEIKSSLPGQNGPNRKNVINEPREKSEFNDIMDTIFGGNK